MRQRPQRNTRPYLWTAAALPGLFLTFGVLQPTPLPMTDETQVQEPRLANPLPGARVSSRFGARPAALGGETREHTGIDLVSPRGTPVGAAAAGTVETAEERTGWGKLVIVDHGDGYKTYYAHLDSLTVERGQLIHTDDAIGTVGSTGWTTAVHLHFEVHYQDAPTNPDRFVTGW